MSHRWKRLLMALLIILAGGALRLPLEQRYTAEMRRRQILEAPLNVSLRDELGQTFFIAVLGGFRSVVASIMELKTITPWSRENWGVVDEYYAICNKLQPREEHYWEQRAWHLAANARDSYRYDSTCSEEAARFRAQQSIEKGMAVLREGLTWLPQSWKLWDRLGYYASMPYNELPDHAAAAEYYAKAASLPGSRRLYWRLHVYQVARIPGREREAWDKLMALYNNIDDRTTSVEAELIRLFPTIRLTDPLAKLPADLVRLINPASVLNKEEENHARVLREAFREKVRTSQPGEATPRPPQIWSPSLPQKN